MFSRATSRLSRQVHPVAKVRQLARAVALDSSLSDWSNRQLAAMPLMRPNQEALTPSCIWVLVEPYWVGVLVPATGSFSDPGCGKESLDREGIQEWRRFFQSQA